MLKSLGASRRQSTELLFIITDSLESKDSQQLKIHMKDMKYIEFVSSSLTGARKRRCDGSTIRGSTFLKEKIVVLTKVNVFVSMQNKQNKLTPNDILIRLLQT